MIKHGICILIILLFGTIAKGQNYSIILGRPTDKSITLNILFDQNTDYYIEYGTVPGVYGKTTTNYIVKRKCTR